MAKPLSVPKPSQSTSTGSQEEKVPDVVTSFLHTGSPLSHCRWTDLMVQNKTTDKEEIVKPSCRSWHPLESRATRKAIQGCPYDLCAQTQEQGTREQVPRTGL